MSLIWFLFHTLWLLIKICPHKCMWKHNSAYTDVFCAYGFQCQVIFLYMLLMQETRQHYLDCGLLGHDTVLSVRIKVFSSTVQDLRPNIHVSFNSCKYFVQTCCLCFCRNSRFLLYADNHVCISMQNTTIYVFKHHKILRSYKINTFF